MAKTTRDKKTAEAAEVRPDKILSPSHLLSIETQQRDVDRARLLMAVEEQSLRNMILENELLSLKIEKQKSRLQMVAKEHLMQDQRYAQLKNEIFEVYGITDSNFGYDPLTGKIVAGKADNGSN